VTSLSALEACLRVTHLTASYLLLMEGSLSLCEDGGWPVWHRGSLIRDLVIAPLARESGLLQLHGLLLRICLLGFELSLSVPHLVLPILRGGDGPVHHGVEVGVDLNSNHGPQLRVKTTEKKNPLSSHRCRPHTEHSETTPWTCVGTPSPTCFFAGGS
jgi:hypothetical protein